MKYTDDNGAITQYLIIPYQVSNVAISPSLILIFDHACYHAMISMFVKIM